MYYNPDTTLKNLLSGLGRLLLFADRSKVTEACRAAVLACVERSTNSEGRIVEVNAFADFFSKAMSEFALILIH